VPESPLPTFDLNVSKDFAPQIRAGVDDLSTLGTPQSDSISKQVAKQIKTHYDLNPQ